MSPPEEQRQEAIEPARPRRIVAALLRVPHRFVAPFMESLLPVLTVGIAAGAILGLLVIGSREGGHFLGAGLGGLVGCVGLVAYHVLLALPRRRIPILVGVDGVRVRSRLIPYSEIEAIRLDGAVAARAYIKTIVLHLRGGRKVPIGSLHFPPLAVDAADNVRQAPFLAAMEQGLSDWQARPNDADLAAEALLARGDSAPAEWLKRLRALGAGATATYRDATLSHEALSRLLASPAARPSSRAAAAIALKASEERPSGKRLRIDSAAFADTSLCAAALELEAASDDAALLKALRTLEIAERRAWAPPND